MPLHRAILLAILAALTTTPALAAKFGKQNYSEIVLAAADQNGDGVLTLEERCVADRLSALEFPEYRYISERRTPRAAQIGRH